MVSQHLTAAWYIQNWVIRMGRDSAVLPVGEWKILAKTGDVQVGFQKKFLPHKDNQVARLRLKEMGPSPSWMISRPHGL